jgi:hypothetical protein
MTSYLEDLLIGLTGTMRNLIEDPASLGGETLNGYLIPIGFREETDEEFRTRIKAELAKAKS